MSHPLRPHIAPPNSAIQSTFIFSQLEKISHILEKLESHLPFKTAKPISKMFIDVQYFLSKSYENKNTLSVLDKLALPLNVYENYEAYHTVYTDASKTCEGVGIGVYDATKNMEISRRLSPDLCISSAECCAIKEALQHLEAVQPSSPVVILTDSKSTCQQLEVFHAKPSSDPIIENIAKIIHGLSQKITIQWIPGHTGIPGNEKADALAKQFSGLDISSFVISFSDALRLVKNLSLQTWQEQYSEESQHKGIHLFSIQPIVSPKPWFETHKNQFSRQELILLTRLRTGHATTKATLHKMKITDSPLCTTCNVIEDMTHVMKDCRRYDAERTFFEEDDYRSLLARNKLEDLKKILRFLKKTGCKL